MNIVDHIEKREKFFVCFLLVSLYIKSKQVLKQTIFCILIPLYCLHHGQGKCGFIFLRE